MYFVQLIAAHHEPGVQYQLYRHVFSKELDRVTQVYGCATTCSKMRVTVCAVKRMHVRKPFAQVNREYEGADGSRP